MVSAVLINHYYEYVRHQVIDTTKEGSTTPSSTYSIENHPDNSARTRVTISDENFCRK